MQEKKKKKSGKKLAKTPFCTRVLNLHVHRWCAHYFIDIKTKII